MGRQGGILIALQYGIISMVYSTSYIAPLSQVPPLGGANHISLSPVISQRLLPQQSIDKALGNNGESQFALQAVGVIQLKPTVQPAAFSLIRVQSQRSSSSSCTIQLESTIQPAAFALSILADQGAVSTQSPFLYLPPSLPLLFLLSYLFFFLCPSVMSLSDIYKCCPTCINVAPHV